MKTRPDAVISQSASAPVAGPRFPGDNGRAAARAGVARRRGRGSSVLIVFDHLGYENGVVHGPARLLINIMPRLRAASVDVHAVILRKYHPFAEEFARRGVELTFFGREKWDPRSLADITRFARKCDAGVLHLCGEKALLMGRAAAALTGRLAIIHLHDSLPPTPVVRWMGRRLQPWTHLALGCASAVSELASSDWRVPRERIRTLYYGIEVDRFRNPEPGARARVREELGIADRTPVVGIIGRLMPGKGHALLLRALGPLLRKLPEAKLLVVGDGRLREESEALAGELGVASSVRFLGQRGDVPEVLAAIDVVCMPSQYGEGMPITAMEAMAAGRPVVAYPVAGIPDVVLHERTGVIVKQDDVEGLAEAMARLLGDDGLRARMSEACVAHSENFLIDEHVRQLKGYYRALLDGQELPQERSAL